MDVMGGSETDTSTTGDLVERLGELRESVRSGHYNVPARAVAEAILRRITRPSLGLEEGWTDLTETGGAL